MPLTGVEARQRLQSIERSDWQDQRNKAIRKLGGTPRHIATAVAEPSRDLATVYQLDDLKVRKRRRVFEALAPDHGAAVERAWDFLATTPYQSGFSRRPFRAPRWPQLSLHKRRQWLWRVSELLWKYPGQDLAWFAGWTPHLGHGSATLGWLFAAEIDTGPDGDAVFESLLASARSEHPVGMMGRHVVSGLLGSSRPAGWTEMEALLLAAQRQEGVRQVILEAVDEAHPQAFRRMVDLLMVENLTRFSSVVRACDVWLGFGYEAGDRKAVDRMLGLIADGLDEPRGRSNMIDSGDAEAGYAGLWCSAFHDVGDSFDPAIALLRSDDPATRLAATYFVGQLGLTGMDPHLLAQLDDADDRVAWRAVRGLSYGKLEAPDAFDRLERFADRLPNKKTTLEPLLWEWLDQTVDIDTVHRRMVEQLEGDDPLRMRRHLDAMSPATRRALALQLVERSKNPRVREVLLDLAADRSEWVREIVFPAIAKSKITPEEAPRLEALLTRKTASVRRAVLIMLAGQKDERAFASAERLLASRNALQREAGLDLLKTMIDEGRSAERARQLTDGFGAGRQLTAEETHLTESIAAESEVATLEDCLGLIDPSNRTVPPQPTDRGPAFDDHGATKLWRSADAFVADNRDLEVRYTHGYGSDSRLYGDMQGGAPWRLETVAEGRPLTELWREWWLDRGSDIAAGVPTVLRAVASVPQTRRHWAQANEDERWEQELRSAWTIPVGELGYPNHAATGLRWLWVEYLDAESVEFLVDAAETTLARIPDKVRGRGLITVQINQWSKRDFDWRDSVALVWVNMMRRAFAERPDVWDEDSVRRMWAVLGFLDEPSPKMPRRRAGLHEAVAAYRLGAANDSDMVDHFIGPGPRHRPDSLAQVTRRRPQPLVDDTPGLGELISTIVNRILEVELSRGEMPTAASNAALSLRSVVGAERLVQLVKALGRRSFTRGWTWDVAAPHAVLSHLIRVSVPAEDDTPEQLAELVRAAKLKERRLLEVAVYAPQWAGLIEASLGWQGLEDAVHWIHAHTKDNKWRVDQDIREIWAAEVASRTRLTAEELTEGAVDVSWYRRSRAHLGDERWAQLDKAAKFASGGGGHKRAQLYADALAGDLDASELRSRIFDKRHQDAVRALGLLPLPAEEPGRTDVVLDRYSDIQEFVRGSRKFGSQRRTSERKAADTGLDNLARTAGYEDPQRLQWAMETAAVADLAEGPLVVERVPYVISLGVDDTGAVALTVMNDGKRLKSVPAKHRKDPEVVELRTRKKELARQASRMRISLESSMIRGDEFDPAELRNLMRHPILRPVLERLVWVSGHQLGYLDETAYLLRDYAGNLVPVGDHPLRIAHAHDLLASGSWSAWQHECFVAERIQPFKQVFRELYVLTEAERVDGAASRRYAGHQVNPRQAMALFGARGWVIHPEDGPTRTFHDAGVTARLGIMGGWFTPAEVEGMTLEVVVFSKAGEWRAMPIADVPPRVFSETMRDLDLVVSVAHVGGVDPEASASTVEMRQTLVDETARLLGLDNISFSGPHAVVEGHFGSYSIHLGSATVHQRPGGALCIIPVSAQHRGRLFLPFADDDPRTAEVVSKVVMLARDKEIKDPTILEQLVR